MSKIKKIIKKVDPLMGGDKILDKLGLPSVFGDKSGFLAEPAVPTAGTAQPVAASPTAVSDETLAARESQRKRQLAAAGMGGNQLTSSRGLSTPASTSAKSLLGS